jgi:FSR family fosmidomycin resistance protein-like MFS transporter
MGMEFLTIYWRDMLRFVRFRALLFSSLVQPLFGHFADRLSKPWFMPVGVVLAGLGIAVIGVAPNYHFILFVAAVSGLGVAAYHPEAARLVNYVAVEKKRQRP